MQVSLRRTTARHGWGDFGQHGRHGEDEHRNLGPGLLESAYELCLAHELSLRRLRFDRQRAVRVSNKGDLLDCGYRLDFVVGDPVALLVNLNVTNLNFGLRRLTRKPDHLPVFPCLPVFLLIHFSLAARPD